MTNLREETSEDCILEYLAKILDVTYLSQDGVY